MQYVLQRGAVLGGVRLAAQDREDGADRDVDVDVARPVEWIEDDDVLAVLPITLDDDGFFVFLRSHNGHVASVAETLEKCVIGDDVELLHDFALHILAAGSARDIGQPGPADLIGNDFGRQRDAREKPGELAAGGRTKPALLFENMLLDGHDGSVHASIILLRAATVREWHSSTLLPDGRGS